MSLGVAAGARGAVGGSAAAKALTHHRPAAPARSLVAPRLTLASPARRSNAAAQWRAGAGRFATATSEAEPCSANAGVLAAGSPSSSSTVHDSLDQTAASSTGDAGVPAPAQPLAPAAAAVAEAAPAAAAATPLPPAEPQAPAAPTAGSMGWTRGKWLLFGGSVAAVVALTVFRREIAPALRWVIMQVNSLTDKSVLTEVKDGHIEAIATGLAVIVSIYWSLTEFKASQERMKAMEATEARLVERVDGMASRLEGMEARLEGMAAQLAALQQAEGGPAVAGQREAAAIASGAAQMAAELQELRQEAAGAAKALAESKQVHH